MNPAGLSLDLEPSRPLTADPEATTMKGKRDPNRFTRIETIHRLKEAKDYLSNKERAAFLPGTVYLPPGYYALSDENYYAAPRLDLQQKQNLQSYVSLLGRIDWSLNGTFFVGSVSQFVDSRFHLGAPVGTTVDIVYYSWSNLEARKFAALWLGTWHHSPLLVWVKARKPEDQAEPVVKFDFLPKYIDLIH